MRLAPIPMDFQRCVEWVRFIEPHLPDTLRQSPTHKVCRTDSPSDARGPWMVPTKPSPMRRAYAFRLIHEYPDQYAAFVAMLRITGRL